MKMKINHNQLSQKSINIIFISFFLLILIGYLSKELKKINIEKHKVETCAKVYEKYRTGSSLKYIRYEFYHNGKRILAKKHIKSKDKNNYIGKYFKVYYSSKKPERSFIDLKKRC